MFFYCFARATMQFKGELNARLELLGISPPGYLILEALEAAGPSSQNALGRSLGIDQASMVRFVDALEGDGFVRRLADRHDRRARLLSATRAGQGVRRKARAASLALEAEFFANVPASEKKRWHASLRNLLEAREASDAPEPQSSSDRTRLRKAPTRMS